MPALDDAAVDAAIAGTGWSREGQRLARTVTHEDFAQAMAFVNAVAALAEVANHHPDIAIHWATVELSLWTHTAGGITQADVELATAIDALSAG